MNSVKILHIADIHFGRKISSLPAEKADLRRNETYITLEHTLERFSDADIVLIAGDIFDSENDTSSSDGLARIFEKHSEQKFFIACGNHDCLESPAMKNLSRKIGDNTVIFNDSMESFTLEKLGVCIYGMSFGAPCSYTSFLHDFRVKNCDMINLMVMHADVASDSRYNPITCEEIGSSGLDYLALGHIHKYSGILKSQKTRYAYPGVFEPQGFDETGECGVIYGEINKDCVNLDFYPVSCRRYHCVEVDISDFSTEQEIVLYLSSIINADDLYRIIFIGNKNGFEPNLNLYNNLLKPFYIEFEDCTSYSENILDFCDESTLKGRTAHHLKRLKDETQCSEDVFLQACDILTKLMGKG